LETNIYVGEMEEELVDSLHDPLEAFVRFKEKIENSDNF